MVYMVNGEKVELHIGDRVKYNRFTGEVLTGTVVRFYNTRLGIEFDNDFFAGGHNLDGYLPEGSRRGMRMDPQQLIFTGEHVDVDTLCSLCGEKKHGCVEVGRMMVCPDCYTSECVPCAECGKTIVKNLSPTVDGNHICHECVSSKYMMCVCCNHYVKRDGAHSVDGRIVCESCYENKTAECAKCGRRQFIEAMIGCGGRRYCRTCADELYPRCKVCGRRHVAAHTVEVDFEEEMHVHICNGCMSRVKECVHCGKKMLPGTYQMVGDKPVCFSCLVEKYFMCKVCGRYHLNAEGFTLVRDEFGLWKVCPECLPKCARCDHCGELYAPSSISTMHTPDGDKKVCTLCRMRLYRPCCSCGNSVWADGEVIKDRYYCKECAPLRKLGLLGVFDGGDSEWEAPCGVTNYGFKPHPLLFPHIDKLDPLYGGFELEVDNRSREYHDWNHLADRVNKMLGYTYIKHDGSLRNGMEIVTHPAKLDFHTRDKHQAWVDVMSLIRESGLSGHSSGSAGLHVHMSSAPLEFGGEDTVEKIIYIWSAFWGQLVKFSRRDTRDSSQMGWAKRLDARVYADMPDGLAIDTLKDRKASACNDRYQAVNLRNPNTIEFRLFRSTLHPDTLFATLQLVDVLTRAAMKHTLGELRKMTWTDLTQSDYPELNAYLESRKRVTGYPNWLPSDEDQGAPVQVALAA